LEDQTDQLKRLLEKRELTTEEQQWLLDYLENSDGTELRQIMQRIFTDDLENTNDIGPAISEKLLRSIHEKLDIPAKPKKPRVVRLWTLRIAVAASVVGLITLGTYLWFKTDSKKETAETNVKFKSYKNDVPPGGDKAILTLADGSKIILDTANNGTLANQGTTKIIKLGGKLSYNTSKTNNNEILYNTISTPRGGQYQIELPDGSQVWLNAASSLHFPTAFAGKERRVEIMGEVYFEVAKNADKPFIVTVNGAEVRVLGTHFNVMAYGDEAALKTTLLEGSIKFVNRSITNMLKPGQQSQLAKDGQVKVISGIDANEVLAWKNGIFDFEGADIESITRQLSRWYDVEVVYNTKINDLFYAVIPRNTKLSDVLKALELTGKVRFEIEGKKIIVMP
jgi:transmembrane sensor